MTPTEEMVKVAARALAPELWADHDNMTPTERAVWEAGLTAKKFIAEEKAKVALTAALAAMWQDPKLVLPKKPGLRDYEYVDCLILYKGEVLKRPWNCEHLCWDDEHYDDFFCHPTDPTAWTFLPAPSQLSKRDDAERDSIQEA